MECPRGTPHRKGQFTFVKDNKEASKNISKCKTDEFSEFSVKKGDSTRYIFLNLNFLKFLDFFKNNLYMSKMTPFYIFHIFQYF